MFVQKSKISEAELKIYWALKNYRLLLYAATDGQGDFHRDLARLRVLLAANQIGKSYSAAAELWWFITRSHPWRIAENKKNPGPRHVLIAVGSWGSSYNAVCKKIYELCPKHLIDWTQTEYRVNGHWTGNRIIMKDGSVIDFVTSKGGSVSSAGATADALWIDEPPRPDQWGELLQRVSNKHGPVWITCTPIDSQQDLDWFEQEIYGDETRKSLWSITRLELCVENAPWKTEEQIEEIKSLTAPWEYDQRILGKFSGVAKDKYMYGFEPKSVISIEDIPEKYKSFGLGIDHGEGAGKEQVILLGEDYSGRIFALDEYYSKGYTTTAQDAIEIRDLVIGWGLSPSQISLIRGDINSSGKDGGGFSINKKLSQELYEYGFKAQVKIPVKGPGSVNKGLILMNQALLAGNLLVADTCENLIKSMKNWRGKNDKYKDPIDAFRYIAYEYLNPRSRVTKYYME